MITAYFNQTRFINTVMGYYSATSIENENGSDLSNRSHHYLYGVRSLVSEAFKLAINNFILNDRTTRGESLTFRNIFNRLERDIDSSLGARIGVKSQADKIRGFIKSCIPSPKGLSVVMVGYNISGSTLVEPIKFLAKESKKLTIFSSEQDTKQFEAGTRKKIRMQKLDFSSGFVSEIIGLAAAVKVAQLTEVGFFRRLSEIITTSKHRLNACVAPLVRDADCVIMSMMQTKQNYVMSCFLKEVTQVLFGASESSEETQKAIDDVVQTLVFSNLNNLLTQLRPNGKICIVEAGDIWSEDAMKDYFKTMAGKIKHTKWPIEDSSDDPLPVNAIELSQLKFNRIIELDDVYDETAEEDQQVVITTPSATANRPIQQSGATTSAAAAGHNPSQPAISAAAAAGDGPVKKDTDSDPFHLNDVD